MQQLLLTYEPPLLLTYSPTPFSRDRRIRKGKTKLLVRHFSVVFNMVLCGLTQEEAELLFDYLLEKRYRRFPKEITDKVQHIINKVKASQGTVFIPGTLEL